MRMPRQLLRNSRLGCTCTGSWEEGQASTLEGWGLQENFVLLFQAVKNLAGELLLCWWEINEGIRRR